MSVITNMEIQRQEISVFSKYTKYFFKIFFSFRSKKSFTFIHMSCIGISFRAWPLEVGSDSQICGQSKVGRNLMYVSDIKTLNIFIISHTSPTVIKNSAIHSNCSMLSCFPFVPSWMPQDIWAVDGFPEVTY